MTPSLLSLILNLSLLFIYFSVGTCSFTLDGETYALACYGRIDDDLFLQSSKNDVCLNASGDGGGGCGCIVEVRAIKM